MQGAGAASGQSTQSGNGWLGFRPAWLDRAGAGPRVVDLRRGYTAG